MRFDVLTLFPEFVLGLQSYGLIGKAIEAGRIELGSIDIRNFSRDKHRRVDDAIFGGGPGMLMTPEPIYESIQSCRRAESKVLFLSPQGRVLDQALVQELAQEEHLILLCGHYEGIDQRIIDHYVDMEVSIGDYVLTGGEIPAMVLIDSISRFIDGVLGNEESVTEDSHYDGLLKYPVYTRPRVFQGHEVPEVLLSGDHGRIEAWRQEQSLEVTRQKRPDLLKKSSDN
ncbi:MAG: tRNA (guanosine(37)-N1)-methyltransferase TrmD [Tissierellia bacterium]|nr:tRNA (guanosine(37)-N1)-methyltransferase TrmD [Tissierellia bacterium]